MKVLIVSSRYQPNGVGGAEKVAQHLAESLVARGHDAVVATLKDPRGNCELTQVNGVRVHYLPVRNIYFLSPGESRKHAALRALWHATDRYNPFMAASLGRILDAEHPDVVNSHNIGGFSVAIWRAVKSRGLPLVHTAHDYYLMCPRGTMCSDGRNCTEPCLLCRAYTRPQRRLSRLADVVVSVSGFVQERYERLRCFPRAERVVIHNARGGTKEDPERVHEPDGILRFGYLGRIHPTKGMDLLLRSFLGISAPKANLLIAGRGEAGYEQKLKAMANSNAGVHWLGFVQPEALLRQADVLVVPSLWQDPAPLVVLEALAHGLPIIGSRRGGIPELMGEGTGWVFDPDEPGALTRAMQLAIDSRDELPAMGERAIQRARHFSTEVMVNEYLQAYSRAIDRNGAKYQGRV